MPLQSKHTTLNWAADQWIINADSLILHSDKHEVKGQGYLQQEASHEESDAAESGCHQSSLIKMKGVKTEYEEHQRRR